MLRSAKEIAERLLGIFMQARPDQRGESYAVRKTATALQPLASLMPCFVSRASCGENPHLETLALSLVRSGRGKPDTLFFPINPRSILWCFGR